MKLKSVAAALSFALATTAVTAHGADAPEKPKAIEGAGKGIHGSVTGEAASQESRTYPTVNAVMRRYTRLFETAHKRLLKDNPKATGRLVVEFVIKRDGSVDRTKVVASDFAKFPEFEKEILEKVQKAKFLPVEKGEAKVTFPLAFDGK